MILAVMRGIYAVGYIEACKNSGFEPMTPWQRCDALTNWAIKRQTSGAGHFWVLRSLGGMNFEVRYEIFHILNCWCEIKWAMIFAVMNLIYAIEYKEAWNSQDFNRVWTHDLVYWCEILSNWAMKAWMVGAGNKSYIDMNQSVENEQYISPSTQVLYTALLGLWCQWYILFNNLINFIVNGRK